MLHVCKSSRNLFSPYGPRLISTVPMISRFITTLSFFEPLIRASTQVNTVAIVKSTLIS